MNIDATAGARVATWWVEAITRTAEGRIALDRRAEVASDVHEQLTEAWHRDALASGSRAVVGRVARGVPSDLAWRIGLELRPSRFAWHLRNPSTVITVLFVVMFPINWVADSAWPGTRARAWLYDYRIPLWVATDFIGGCILLFAALVVAARIWRRWTAGAERFDPQTWLERARRSATAAIGVTWAGGAVFRFGALELVGGACFFASVACILLYMGLLAATIIVKVLTLGRYLPKIGP